MPKQLNVSLNFNANTSQAKSAIQSLLGDLNKLSTINSTSFHMDALTSDIMEAKNAAKELGMMLESSFNVDTGKLDLNKFNQSLKMSETSLTQYGNKLMALGPAGDKAFLKIAQSIVETEAPLRRSGTLLKEFGTTLANTARWQISSSILHGFMGAVQSAYGYAQNLDKSLNNIRIVTGQNAEQMAIFAEKANKAAKALSTTTTDYTNASLIYYQQGLDDNEVTKRTDITIKMANAAGQSAEIVSDQLTAVWNNFYDGSKSLEYYADVMTALGAATASSTDEIAGGLEKFAAIGETIGLSYEYAASALATITSNTRQSEEVVGTALKTIFARIQGLNLGETLDDGTTLNKYSEALKKVGISIFDSAGELKNMDNILDEMAGKWGTLTKAQQTALAQTVAGVRQYTQLIALMENWNNGDNDSMMANLDTAYGSTGALQEQADIYAESWEASKDRVTAALEGIYDSVLDKDFFTTFNNGLAGFLGTVETLVDAMGGMPGILMLIGSLGTRIFNEQIAGGINNALHSLKNFTGASMIEIRQMKKEAYEYAMAMTAGVADRPGVQAQRDHLGRVYKLQLDTEKAMQGVNSEQAEAIKKAYELAKGYSEVAVEAAAAQEEAEELNLAVQKQQSDKFGAGAKRRITDSTDVSVGLVGADLIKEAKNVENIGSEMGGAGQAVSDLRNAMNEYKAILKDPEADQKAVAESADRLRTAMEGVEKAVEMQGEAFAQFQKVLGTAAEFVATAEYDFHELQAQLMDTTPTTTQVDALRDLATRMQECGLPADDLIAALKEYDTAVGDGSDEAATAAALSKLGQAFSKCKISTKDAEKAIKTYGISLVKNHKNSANYRKILEQMGDKLDDSVKSAKKVATAMVNNANATKKAELAQKGYAESLEKVKAKAASFGSGAAKMTQGLSSMGMALSSLQGLWSTLTDPDTSGFEKFIAILTSSGMVVGSFSSGLKSLKEGFSLVKTASDGTTSSLLSQAMQMKTAEIQEDNWISKIKAKIAAKQAENAASAQSVAANSAEAASDAAAAEAQEEKNEEEAKGVVVNAAGAAGSMADAGAKGAEAVGTTAAGTAQGFLNTMISPFIALIGAALVAVLPYIAAMGALVAVVGAVAYAVTAESRALKEAEEREQRAADMAKRVSEELNEIASSLKNIESKRDAFKDLEKGTTEWYQTLNEVNAEVTELVEKFPELLEMGAIFRDQNGMLGISQAGQDYVNQEIAKQQATATNIELQAEKNTAQVKYNSEADDFEYYYTYDTKAGDTSTKYKHGTIEGAAYTPTTGKSTLSEEAVKELMAGYAVYGDAMFKNEEYANKTIENVSKVDENAGFMNDDPLEWLQEYENVIQRQAERLDTIDQKNEQMIANRLSAYGSDRTVDQAIDLVGDEWYSISGEGNKEHQMTYTNQDGDEKTFNMNRSVNYTDETMPQEIKDFMKLQGENVEYVAQRNGKLVLEVDGEEVYYSEDEVYEAIGEMYSMEAMEKAIRDNLTAAYSNVASGVGELDTEELIQLDNLYLGLEEAFAGDAAATSEAFQTIVDAYGTGAAELEQLAEDTTYIDKQSAAFQRLVTNASLAGDQLKVEMQKLNAVGQIDSMDSYFNDAAESMGLSEEDARGMQEHSKALMAAAVDESSGLDPSLATNAERAADLAVEIARMNTGVEQLAEGFEDWSSILKKSSKTSAEYSKAMGGMKKALSNVLDVEEDMVSNDFVTEHMDDIAKAAEGDADAIDRLRASMDEEIIANITLGQSDEFIENVERIYNEVQNLATNLPDIEVGAMLQDEAFLAAANELVSTAEMSADEANACFAGIGYEPVYSVADIENANSMDMPSASNTISLDHIGWSEVPIDLPDWLPGDHTLNLPNITYSTKPVTKDPEEAGADMRLTSFSGDGKAPEIKGFVKKATGSQNDYSSTNAGGPPPGGTKSGGTKSGGSKSSKPKKAKRLKNDTKDRYKEIEDQLNDVRDASDEASKAADRLYGAGRIAQMAKVNALLIKEVELLKKKKKEAQDYLRMDKIKLNQAASAAGVSLNYDEKGNVTNYTEQRSKLIDEYELMADAVDAKGDAATDEDHEKLAEAEQKITDLTEAMTQYNDTRELIEDIDSEVTDKFYEWQDNNAEMWNYGLDIAINFNEDALELLDSWLQVIEEDFYRAAEGAAVLSAEILACNASAGTYIASLAALGAQYATQSISPEAFVEGLNKVKDGLQGTADKIRELDNTMLHYYGDTIAKGREEIDKITNQLEHHTSVLEHYNSLLDLMGKSTDYESKGMVLAGQVETAKNEMIAAREEADLFARQAEQRYIDYQGSIFRTSTEMRKQQYEDALQASMETQEEYLSKAEAYASALNAVLENSLAMYGQQLENALTGGTSFDQMATKMERMVSLQEEYLTATNKIYETEKLMNQAQQQIDKTTNTVAKKKLKDFINETNQLQEKTKLSKFELDIQTAKYELLLAEIALEEAQAAKSQVRLQRDAEGNFGYVYTSDASQVAEAEQNYADKQNELYNMALEGINTYAEKYQETTREMYETLTEIDQQYREGAFESEEEYRAAKLAAQEYYFQKLEEFQDLFNIATEVDANAQKDAWGSSYSDMINSTEEWKTEVIKYEEAVGESFDEWKGEMQTLAQDLGLDYRTLADSVGSVTTQSAALTEELTKDGGVMDQVALQIDLVAVLTNIYASLRWAVLGLAAAYSILAAALTAVAAIQAVVGIDFSGVMSLFNVLSGGAASFLGAGSGGGLLASLASAAGSLVGGLIGFDSGGYTGEWGPYGKMAVLHEKELILDKYDTANFLKSMELLDNISKTIDLQSANQQMSGALMAAPAFESTRQDTLEQMVTIEANFPNVSSRTEIEEAFTTLVNRASQYANRK